MKDKDWDKKLDKVTAAKYEGVFLRNLGDWLFELSGNVNAAMRLKAIALRLKEKN